MPKSRNPIIEFDKLQMYFRHPYVLDFENAYGSVTLTQPSIGDIVEIGEKRFYTTLSVFTTNTTNYRLPLWKMGIDWNELSDYKLFTMLVPSVDKEVTSLLFDGIDFSKFQLYKKTLDDKEFEILFDPESNIEINEEMYFHISQYFRQCFNIFPEEKITLDPVMKRWFIDKDEKELHNRGIKEEKGTLEDTSIQSVISACVNHPGFKYKLHELKDVGVYEFFDSVRRLQVYENTTALLKGMYSGFIDSTGIKPNDYNFMKNIGTT